MSAWSEELDTLYKTQDLCAQHAEDAEVPVLIVQNFVTLQTILLPKLHLVFVDHQDVNPAFAQLSVQFPTEAVATPTWGTMHQAIGNLILAMHLAIPYVKEPLFEETFEDDLYPEYEMITVSVGNDLLSVIQSPDLPVRLQQLRAKLEELFGFPFPKIKFADDIDLDHHAYTISIAGQLRQGVALHNKQLAISTKGQFPSVQGIECTDPIFGLPAKWITSMFEKTAKQQDCVVLSPLAVIISHVERLLRLQYHSLLTSDVLTNLIKEHRDVASMFIALPKEEWTSIFKHCLRTQIPLVELPRMLDTIRSIQQDLEPDVSENGDYLYIALRLQFPPRNLKGLLEKGKLSVLTLSDALQNTLIGEMDIGEGRMRVPHFDRLLHTLKTAMLATRDQTPALLCPDVLVPDITRRLERQGFAITVVMESEVPEHVQVVPVAPPLNVETTV